MIATIRYSANFTATNLVGVTLFWEQKESCRKDSDQSTVWDKQPSKLKWFYFKALLPDLAYPHHNKGS